MKISATTTSPLDKLRGLDPTITAGTALATATGYTLRWYDGTTASFEGEEQYIPPTGGPYLPPGPGDQYARIVFTVAALPQCDAARGWTVFPRDAVREAYKTTWFHSDVYGGY
jgi:hypothetical protein